MWYLNFFIIDIKQKFYEVEIFSYSFYRRKLSREIYCLFKYFFLIKKYDILILPILN